jgi:hypothetical protein
VLDNESHPIPPTQQLLGSALRHWVLLIVGLVILTVYALWGHHLRLWTQL